MNTGHFCNNDMIHLQCLPLIPERSKQKQWNRLCTAIPTCTRRSHRGPVKLCLCGSDGLCLSDSHYHERPGWTSAILIRRPRQLTGESLQRTLRPCLDSAQEINNSPDRHIPKKIWVVGVESMKVDGDSLWLQHRVPLTEAIKGSQTGVRQQAAPLILMTGGKYVNSLKLGLRVRASQVTLYFYQMFWYL